MTTIKGDIINRTEQENEWSGEFGEEYTKRNIYSSDELDQFYKKRYGLTKTKINEEFIRDIDKNSKILEVGCNVGNQLVLLKKMGYHNIWGIDVSKYATNIARDRLKNANIIEASALNLPFEDNYFDLVFTSGLLIHISPDDIEKVLNEIYRCTRSYIWGLEYYTQKGYQNVNYRGKDNLLWKTDFAKLFTDKFSSLTLVRKKIIDYKEDKKQDIVYLLKKEDSK